MKHLCYIKYDYHTYSGYPKIEASCKAIVRYAERVFAEYGKVTVSCGGDFQMNDYVEVQFLYEGTMDAQRLEQKLRTLPEECVMEGLRVTYRTNDGMQGEITEFEHPKPRRLKITKSKTNFELPPESELIR